MTLPVSGIRTRLGRDTRTAAKCPQDGRTPEGPVLSATHQNWSNL